MKRRICGGIVLSGLLSLSLLLGCGTSAASEQTATMPAPEAVSVGLSLDEALKQAAGKISGTLSGKSRVAILAFESESPELSEGLIEELRDALFDQGVADIADQQNLSYVERELGLPGSGKAGDQVSIGQFWGAQAVITGELVETGSGCRFGVKVVNVKTGSQEGSVQLTLRTGEELRQWIAALKRGSPRPESPAGGGVRGGGSAGAFLDQGIRAARTGEWEEARAVFSEALDIDPAYAAAYLQRGKTSLAPVLRVFRMDEFFEGFDPDASARTPAEQGAVNRGIADLTRSLTLEPLANAYVYRGEAYYSLGEYGEALNDFDRARILNPNNPVVRSAYETISSAAAEHDYGWAITKYTEVLQRNPDDPDAYFHRGLAYRRRGKLGDNDLAIADFSSALEHGLMPPQDMDVYFNRGLTYHAQEDYDRAVEDFSTVISREPNNAEAYFNRGLAYSGKEDYDAAIKEYDKAILLDLNSAQFYYQRGVAYSAKKDYDKAVADFKAAAALDSSHAGYQGRPAADLLDQTMDSEGHSPGIDRDEAVSPRNQGGAPLMADSRGIEIPLPPEEETPPILETFFPSAQASGPPGLSSGAQAAPLGSRENPYDWSSVEKQLANADIPYGSYIKTGRGTIRLAEDSEIRWARGAAKQWTAR
jgi:tetratricopeptide (TPR) repeat protein